ncbi:MAG: hypothetical protein LBD43_02335 [Holosporales bacterium]|jgi:hypothetical protein|nr:hypothetical protein [Holosporales bacterium]
MSPEIALYTIAILSGIVIAYQDIMTGRVGIVPLICFFLSCIATSYIRKECCHVLMGVIIIAGITMFLVKGTHAIGAADYVVGISLASVMTTSHMCAFLISCGLFGLVVHIVLASKKIPFTPVMLAAYVITEFVVYY